MKNEEVFFVRTSPFELRTSMNCYLLVGGQSNRMGRSKLDLPFADSTFLQRVMAAAKPVFDRVIAVQRAGGKGVESLPTIFEPPRQEQAPVFGVWRALQDAKGRCFILAIDYPLLTSEVLRYLAGRASQSAAEIVVPRWNGKLQMLCAGYASSLLPRFELRIAAGQLNLHSLTDRLEIIEEDALRARFPGEPLMNVNTPEELREATRHL
ncbi:MAG TPA: molybdenum cofactor guanylyltransferase [Thermoanaerobaculia bacterium]|nr:molybdenum cofactor guanylyltransferase [Thermoanaerobaculia bacterium]